MGTVVHTVVEKETALRLRAQDSRELGARIDKLIATSTTSQDAEALGCGGEGLCPLVGRGIARMLGVSRRAVPTQELAPVQASDGSMSTRVFGRPAKAAGAQDKLTAAAETMRTRIAQLESRGADGRESAARAMKAGNKALALRELKRAKALDAQVAATQQVMDAVESQTDMLENSAMQKQVAAALGATAKTLKKERGILSKAENAVEAASEMRDLHEDLTSIMSGLGDSAAADYDEDELLGELQQMVQVEEEPPPTDHSIKQAQRELEMKHAEYDELEMIRRRLPSAPKAKAKEKEALLHAVSQ